MQKCNKRTNNKLETGCLYRGYYFCKRRNVFTLNCDIARKEKIYFTSKDEITVARVYEYLAVKQSKGMYLNLLPLFSESEFKDLFKNRLTQAKNPYNSIRVTYERLIKSTGQEVYRVDKVNKEAKNERFRVKGLNEAILLAKTFNRDNIVIVYANRTSTTIERENVDAFLSK